MVDAVSLGARQWWSQLRGVTRDGLVRLRCFISLPGGEGWAGRRGAGQDGWTPHRWGWQGHRQLGPAPPPPAKDDTAHATRGWFSSLLWYNHCLYKQRKNNFKNCNKLIKGHYWKAKTESGTSFRDRFQQYRCLASISFLSLDLRRYIKSSCQAKQLFVTLGKLLYRPFTFSFVLSLHFRGRPLWHGGINVVLCAGAYTPGRTNSEK